MSNKKKDLMKLAADRLETYKNKLNEYSQKIDELKKTAEETERELNRYRKYEKAIGLAEQLASKGYIANDHTIIMKKAEELMDLNMTDLDKQIQLMEKMSDRRETDNSIGIAEKTPTKRIIFNGEDLSDFWS